MCTQNRKKEENRLDELYRKEIKQKEKKIGINHDKEKKERQQQHWDSIHVYHLHLILHVLLPCWFEFVFLRNLSIFPVQNHSEIQSSNKCLRQIKTKRGVLIYHFLTVSIRTTEIFGLCPIKLTLEIM